LIVYIYEPQFSTTLIGTYISSQVKRRYRYTRVAVTASSSY